jgi:hypothetical protein
MDECGQWGVAISPGVDEGSNLNEKDDAVFRKSKQ